MRTKFYLLISVMIVSLQTGCLYVARYDGPYNGKVVDQETREPIEGAVVLGTWYTETPTLAGAVHYYYDAREALTDKKGEFSIPGQGLRIMSRLLPMSVLIFKAGYQYIGSVSWGSIKIAYSEEIKWEGDKPIFPLKKLTMEERKKQHADKETIPDNKQRLLIKELNNEYRAIGTSLYPEGD